MAFSTHDIVPDSPTNNFATMSSIAPAGLIAGGVLSEGNLRVSTTGTAGCYVPSSMPIVDGSGKYYVEHLVNYTTDASGILTRWDGGNSFTSPQSVYYSRFGIIYVNGNNVHNNLAVLPVLSSDTPKILGMLIDTDTRQVTYYVDGVKQATSVTYTHTDDLFFVISDGSGNSIYNTDIIINFGQDPTFAGSKSPSTTYTDTNGIGAFYYQPPTDALALCTANLPEMTPTVTGDVPQDYFKAVLYTGNNTSQSITGVGFQPDLVWAKGRSIAYYHGIYDAVRGPSLKLYSNSTDAEVSEGMSSLDGDGFTLDSSNGLNQTSETYVAWCWKAGGAPTADNSNTSGAMTANSVSLNGTLQSNYTPAGSPTVYPTRMSINTDAGFSIVKYTQGDWVPHGLNKTPEMIIVKGLATSWWIVYHKNAYTSNNSYMTFTNNAVYTSGQATRKGLPTSTVFSMYNSGNTFGGMESGSSIIAYCWHSVEGYSKFGSYTGNGSADGPFVYCGFRPSFIIMKSTGTGDWQIYDTARSPYNVSTQTLYVNRSNQEDNNATNRAVDILSNGFKIRSGQSYLNSGNFIFMAFAEQPFKFSNAR